jgi:hypothetical protein
VEYQTVVLGKMSQRLHRGSSFRIGKDDRPVRRNILARSDYAGAVHGMVAGFGTLSDDTKRIRELLKEEIAEDAASREKVETRVLDNEIKRGQKVNAIRVIFGIIIWSITVFNLIFNGFL